MIIKPVNTNVITGFLGVGKTSLIKQLLATKPADETWAILINEFGEIGLDGQLLSQGKQASKLVIKEVAGGCLCCAGGLPIQVAINQLLAKAKPDRLIIEPTGLGHTDQILKLLASEHYQQVIRLNSCLCLVDARKLAKPEYRSHPLFIKQLQCADVILASKSVSYSPDDWIALQDFLAQIGCAERQLIKDEALTEDSLSLHSNELLARVIHALQRPTTIRHQRKPQSKSGLCLVTKPGAHFGVFDAEETLTAELTFNPLGFCKKQQDNGEYISCGWVFEPTQVFDFDKLLALIHGLKLQFIRLKAVMITLDGIACFNLIDGELSIQEQDDALDSRLEIIAVSDSNNTPLSPARLSQASLSQVHQGQVGTSIQQSQAAIEALQTSLLSCRA
ncbi:CobW family GTP-binding protein [Shewanella sp.]|uniref:CobW family GTP-binding protein n=1 Tax=Shewanella sp. TaxID=50422 RepID=UPI00405430ED